MEIYSPVFVDTRKTCVTLGPHHVTTPDHLLFLLYSGIRKKCRLVRRFSTHTTLEKLTSSIQFVDHTRYHGLAQCREGIDGLFLF